MGNLLLNEDELRTAAFVLILNIKDKPARHDTSTVLDMYNFASEYRDPGLVTPNEQALYEMLGVPEIMKMPAHNERFFSFGCNCTEILRDEPKWEQVLSGIR